jgi:hypothetical protein
MKDFDCKTIFEMLSQYLDQELPAVTCEELDRHIRDCAPCVEFVASLKRSIQLCRQYETAEQPPAVPASLKQSLSQAYQEMLARKHSGPQPV